MNGCLLDDAFPTMDNGSGGSSAPSPGCQQSYSSKEARKEERRKAKKCRGPPMAFLDVKDPDRQHLNKLPDVPPMNSATGLREHVPVDAPVGYEAFQGGPNRSPGDECNSDRMCQQLRELLPRSDNDPIGDKVRSIIPILPGTAAAAAPKKNYFGADPDEGFANYSPDAANFLMEPTLQNGFGIGSAPSAALPVPSVSDYWKPLTPSGVETSFFKALPKPGGTYSRKSDAQAAPQDDISRKMDQIMARLDELQRGRTGGASPEQAQTEILLFISSGVFVLFLMDLLVKKGGRLF
jgi:hypothetical protein